jgi:hypothetical protein
MPTKNAPVGVGVNKFKPDSGTLAPTQMPRPGLPLSTLDRPYGAFTYGSFPVHMQTDAYARSNRFEMFGADRKRFDGYVKQFSGSRGEKLKREIVKAAKACQVSAGLLAAVMLTEHEGNFAQFWGDKFFTVKGGIQLREKGLESLYEAGADSYIQDRRNIERAVPAARQIKIYNIQPRLCKERTKRQKKEVWIQDGEVDVNQLVLAKAAMIKYKEIVTANYFRRKLHNNAFSMSTLREHSRFFFTRLAYNPGGKLQPTIDKFLKGENVYKRIGPRTENDPVRGATICTALAIHLNETVFASP